MLDINDIAADVAAADTAKMQDAFLALVAWPDVDEICPRSPDVLAWTLEQVADGLRTDAGPMPAALVEALAREGFTPAGEDDYAAGAAFVLAHLDAWRSRFDEGVSSSVDTR